MIAYIYVLNKLYVVKLIILNKKYKLMPQIKHQKTKTLAIKPNDRSSDFVTPNFIYGCAGGCRNSYCYVMRYNYDYIYINDNIDEILTSITAHAEKLTFPKHSNQVDPIYWVYDIGCSTDISLHWKHYNWPHVFNTFKHHAKIKATFATKYVNKQLLTFNPEEKVRIRFSLMPQVLSNLLEPKTSLIAERIKAISEFIAAGYEVHINFSPIVIYDNWLRDYKELFEQVDAALASNIKDSVKAECIFLTHNPWQHERNLKNDNLQVEQYLWQPEMQEAKVSQYGSQAIRYKANLKAKLIQEWKTIHEKIIPWNKIRYIF